VGRAGHNHRRLRHGRHHPLHGQFAHLPHLAALHDRAGLLLLAFVLDLFFGHHQIALVAVLAEAPVSGGDQDEEAGDDQGNAVDQQQHPRDRVAHGNPPQSDDLGYTRAQQQINDQQDQADLQEGGDHADGRLGREQLLAALDGIQRAEFPVQGFGAVEGTGLQHVGDNRRGHRGQKDRGHQHGNKQAAIDEPALHRVGLPPAADRHAQEFGVQVADLIHEVGQSITDAEQSQQQHQHGYNLLRYAEIALAALFIAPLERRSFSPSVLAFHVSPAPRGGGRSAKPTAAVRKIATSFPSTAQRNRPRNGS